MITIKIRKYYGTKNMVGAKIEELRQRKRIKQKDFIAQLQIYGVDINPTSYSKLEGQTRIVTDIELYYISKILNIDIKELYNEK